METLKLLIIEDDPDQRELIRETLEERFGVGTVVAVASRAEALQQPLSAFDLILSDYNLPDATGMQLLHDIQQRCKTPVIMVTGENVGRIAAEAIRRGATDYVVKFGDYLFTIPLVVEKNLAVAKVRHENERLRAELEGALREVQAPTHLARYLTPKGSVSIDGVSLTLAAVRGTEFEVALIPTTLQLTALGRRDIGWPFNLECDCLAKTVVSWLERQRLGADDE